MPRIAIAGPSHIVTDAAASVGVEGGSVVDVAIVAALTAMCTEPGVCGPGGGGFMTIDIPGQSAVVVDGYMAYPGRGFAGRPLVRKVTMPYGGGVTTLVDAGSIAVPGVFAALEASWGIGGRLPWRVLMDAVATAVEEGFPLSAPCHHYLSDGAAPIFQTDPVARDSLLDDDVSKPIGATVLFPGLAETLRHIGDEGARSFYEGDVAEIIASDLEARGGMLTRQDMETYEAVVREPMRVVLGEWRIGLNPAPAVGGTTVARVLEFLSGTGLEDDVVMAKALVDAFTTRNRETLRSPSTISIAAVDEDGGAVAGSFSAGYGSGVIPAGTGMLMNNALGELELIDGDGEPGERMISNMAPSVARRGADAVAVGSPGAERITTAVATTLTRLAAGADLRTAIDHPRTHPEFGEFGVRLAAEPGLELGGAGLPLRWYERRHMFFGGVNGAGFVDGRLVAHADSRRTGSVAFTTH